MLCTLQGIQSLPAAELLVVRTRSDALLLLGVSRRKYSRRARATAGAAGLFGAPAGERDEGIIALGYSGLSGRTAGKDERFGVIVCDLDLGELQAIEPPRGFGRD